MTTYNLIFFKTMERLQFDHQLDDVIISILSDLFSSTDLDPYFCTQKNDEVYPRVCDSHSFFTKNESLAAQNSLTCD